MAKAKNSATEVVRVRLKELRSERALTQDELCELASLSVDAITRIETGSRVPTIETLEKLASALGVSVAALFDGTVPTPKPHSAPIARVITLLEGQPDAVQRAALDLVRTLVKTVKSTAGKARKR